MKKNSWHIYVLGAIFLLVLAFRLYFAFQTDTFSEDAYFVLRQVESITATGLPTYVDDLSFSGRTHIFPPFYYYFLSFFSLFIGPTLALKIIPNVLCSLLVIIMFFVSFRITKSRDASLFAAFASAFVPVFVGNTVLSASILSLVLPLIFYLIYCLMRIDENSFLYQFLIFSFILAISSGLSFLFIFALLIYLILMKLEHGKQNVVEKEVILFVTLLTLWIDILLYKKAFLMHSYSLIWQNVPPQILSTYFVDIDLFVSLAGVGLLPLLFGVFAVYKYMFKEMNKQTYLLIAFSLSVALLLWLKLITFSVGLVFLGMILIPLFGQSIALVFVYLEKTKIASCATYFWAGVIVLFVFTSVFSTFVTAHKTVDESISDDEISALVWLRENSQQNSVILSTIPGGNLVSSVALRKNVADNDFVLVKNSAAVYEDVEKMFSSFFKSQAIELLDKYRVDYIYFTPRAKELFKISEINYIRDDCFELVYNSTVQVYHSKCQLKQIS
jgi:hypothetical protein